MAMARKSKNTSAEEPKNSKHPTVEEAFAILKALDMVDEEDDKAEEVYPNVLPLLPIRDQVYFPHMIFPLLVGREKSVRALEAAAAQQRYIFIAAQRNLHAEDPDPEDIFTVGIAAEIMQILRVPDGTVRVMLEGLERCRVKRYLQTEPFYRVEV